MVSHCQSYDSESSEVAWSRHPQFYTKELRHTNT
ncbi:hypothetical protein ACP4OV_019429 [Aristida adscensionis]